LPRLNQLAVAVMAVCEVREYLTACFSLRYRHDNRIVTVDSLRSSEFTSVCGARVYQKSAANAAAPRSVCVLLAASLSLLALVGSGCCFCIRCFGKMLLS
jgi:hypothetical protein